MSERVKRRPLGRGLAALFGETETDATWTRALSAAFRSS